MSVIYSEELGRNIDLDYEEEYSHQQGGSNDTIFCTHHTNFFDSRSPTTQVNATGGIKK